MPFPVVAATNTSAESVNTVSHSLALPPGIAAGNLLIAIFGFKGGTDVSVLWPSGWTQFFRSDRVTNVGVAAAYRQATGAGGGSITVTTSVDVKSTHNSYRITGHEDPSIRAPESAAANGNNANPNPPLLVPTIGAKDYLWIAVEINNDDAISVSSYPVGYTNGIQISAGANCNTASARRQLNAASEDPGAFTITLPIAWAAGTLVVHPAATKRARIAFAELEIPDLVSKLARVSFAEFEVPETSRAQVAFAEMEIPETNRARVAFAELEIPATSRAQVSFVEFEVPETSRAQVAFAEMEIPSTNRVRVAFAELEVPDNFRSARVSIAEMVLPAVTIPSAAGEAEWLALARRRIPR